jgi:CubicO group peptidase (beta-lactamase class C family)
VDDVSLGFRARRVSTSILLAMLFLSSVATGTAVGRDTPSGIGPPADDAAIDAYLQQAVADLGIPGLAFALVRGDSAPHVLVVGSADDSGRPITSDTPFMLASVSKAFAATAVLQLVEAGRIDLDAPVRRYLPWFRVADERASNDITVRSLLEQSSGLTTRDGTAPIAANDQADDALERSVRSFATSELAFAPGDGYQYSNANYDTLAEIVQTVAGIPYDQYLERHIYGPLGMTHSHATATAARADGLAEGSYEWLGSVWRSTSMPLPRSMPGSATTFSSIDDMTRWIAVNLGGGTLDGAQILSADGMATLHQGANPTDEFHAYAMGWQVRPLWEALGLGNEGPGSSGPSANGLDDTVALPLLIEHGGSWANGHTYVGLAPAAGWGFALLVNAGDEASHKLDTLEANVLRLLAGREPAPPGAVSDLLVAWRYVLVAGLLALELVSLAWSLLTIRRMRRSVIARPADESDRPRVPWITLGFVLAIALDVLVAWLYLISLPDHFDADVPVMLYGIPDLALVMIPTLALAVVWGPIRTTWLGWLLFRASRRRAPATQAA